MKRRLARQFRYSPLLKLLIHKPWFRAAFLAAVAVVLFGALLVPKIWRTTPGGFEPVVMVSWMDKIQCWSLKRSALQSAAAGEYENAQVSWYLASGQNPGDLSTVRGFLDNFLRLERPDPRMTAASLTQIGWLIRLGGTNSADVVRAARVFDKQRWYDLAGVFLDPLKDRLLPEAEEVYLKALYHKGRIAEFAERIGRRPPDALGPVLALYLRGYEMGWKAGRESAEGEQALAAAMDRPDAGETAARVYLAAAAAQRNPARYQNALHRLALVNQAGVIDHANYWSLLAAQGRKEEAIRLADAFTSSPQNSAELVQLADVYFQLGATNSAAEVLRKFLPSFTQEPEVWICYSSFLQKTEDWAGLRTLGLSIRDHKPLFSKLWAYSYFLEGVSDYRRGLTESADASFAKAAELHCDIPGLSYRMGRDLVTFQHPAQALKILAAIENGERFASSLEFWETYFDAAYGAKDSLAVLKSAEHTYQLKPGDVQFHNRYAAALMLNRRNPDESIKLTLQLLNAYPQSVAAAINHGFALLLNRRVAEARAMFENLAGRSMLPLEANACHLGLFEVYVNLNEWDRARELLTRVDEALLFPTQREWFHQLRDRLPEQIAKRS